MRLHWKMERSSESEKTISSDGLPVAVRERDVAGTSSFELFWLETGASAASRAFDSLSAALDEAERLSGIDPEKH